MDGTQTPPSNVVGEHWLMDGTQTPPSIVVGEHWLCSITHYHLWEQHVTLLNLMAHSKVEWALLGSFHSTLSHPQKIRNICFENGYFQQLLSAHNPCNCNLLKLKFLTPTFEIQIGVLPHFSLANRPYGCRKNSVHIISVPNFR